MAGSPWKKCGSFAFEVLIVCVIGSLIAWMIVSLLPSAFVSEPPIPTHAPCEEKEGMVFIGDLDRVDLLRALWERSVVARYFIVNHVDPPPFDEKKAVRAVYEYIDYFEGRLIKADLFCPHAWPMGYDRDYGKGAFAQVVEDVRETKNCP